MFQITVKIDFTWNDGRTDGWKIGKNVSRFHPKFSDNKKCQEVSEGMFQKIVYIPAERKEWKKIRMMSRRIHGIRETGCN